MMVAKYEREACVVVTCLPGARLVNSLACGTTVGTLVMSRGVLTVVAEHERGVCVVVTQRT
jgi:hypothetical protein